MSTRLLSRICVGATMLFLAASALAGPPLYKVEVTANPAGSGTVTLDPLKDGYQKNNIVSLTARQETGYCFTHWSGDLSGTQNPITLRVSGNHFVTAHFDSGTACGGGGGGGGGSGGGGGTEPPPVAPPEGNLPEAGMVVGYFAQWTIYRRGYLPRHVSTSGSLDQLDVINYAFAAPDASGRCASLDTFADWGKRYDASESVDGIADTVSQPLKGNFNQLVKLKQQKPALRVLISLGGWTESYRFSAIAADPTAREAFVTSCIDMFIRGHFADGIVQAGIFDGIDIDWEYPGSCGATCDYRDEDRENFVALLEEFRRQLDVAEVDDQREYLLTIAAPAGGEQIGKIALRDDDQTGEKGIAPFLDWINVMTYDFHGAWESSGPTNHISALYESSCEPGDGSGNWADKAISAYVTGGVPPGKLVLGMPFYGRGWRAAAVGDGFCVPAGGVPRGTYEKGVDDYEVLARKARPGFWDQATGTHWDFDGSQFWSYDDPCSATWKADYANENGLRGVMFWELSGDDPAASLLTALRGRLSGAAPTCTPPGP